MYLGTLNKGNAKLVVSVSVSMGGEGRPVMYQLGGYARKITTTLGTDVIVNVVW